MIRNTGFEMSLVCSKSEYYVNVILHCTTSHDHSLNWTLSQTFFYYIFFDSFVFVFLVYFFYDPVLADEIYKLRRKQCHFSNLF